jgi:FkbM family methyltransferase
LTEGEDVIRTLVERMVRGFAFRRRLPSDFGGTTLYVSPDAQLKYLSLGERAFDERLLNVAREFIGESDVVWDVGANVGVFAFAAAAKALRGQVLAVEPDLWLALLLERSARLKANRALNVAVLAAACSDHDGAAAFLIAERGRASNALEAAGGRTQMGGVRQRKVVPLLQLDTLLGSFAPPTFVKIDVEGAEVDVLKGATKLLHAVRPRLFIEIGPTNQDEATAILRDEGYRLFDVADAPARREPLDVCPFNTIAIPAELLIAGSPLEPALAVPT